jgi:undecaprenyl diphosphate synthase
LLKPSNKLDLEKLPNHIAIIMDGNGRWAKKRLLPRTAGHKVGVERVRDIIKAADELNIKYLTLYAFSTENWKRPQEEVDMLMKLLAEYLKRELKELDKNGVRINVLGDLEEIPDRVRAEIIKSIETTKNNQNIVLNIALNYGSRQEIIRAVKSISSDVLNSELKIDEVDEEVFKKYLYTTGQPDPDMVIRTSGEQRISNFLLYQIAYSEFIFTDVLWPDFKKENLYEAIIEFQRRKRRFGGI